MLALKPLPGRILVELVEKYSYVATTAEKYDTNTAGICIDGSYVVGYPFESLDAQDTQAHYVLLKGKLVFFEEYKAHATIERDGKKYAYVKVEDLDGYED